MKSRTDASREPYGTEDLMESLEEGMAYVPPISPTPEEEGKEP